MTAPAEKEPATPECARRADEHDSQMQAPTGDFTCDAGRKARLLRSVGILRRGYRVLDFGCGTGSLSAAIHALDSSCRLDGYDLSRESLHRVPAELRQAGTYTMNREKLSGPYDLIVIAGLLHRVAPGERDALLADAATLLCSDGAMAIIERNPLNPLTRKIVRDGPFEENAFPVHAWESLACLKRIGLRKLRVRFAAFVPDSLNVLAPVEALLGWCPLGGQYIAYARRPSDGTANG